MKKTICLLMLFTSIAGSLCAQPATRADKTFEVPDNIIFNRRFYINLENGNKVQIEVSDIADLDRVANIDSLLQVFLQDIAPLKDSLSDPLTAKRIDYVTDARGRKKSGFSNFNRSGRAF